MDFDDVIAATDVGQFAGEPARSRELRPQGHETIRALLRAGRQAVDEVGQDMFRIDDVVERADVAHGTFYLYFRDRQDLLRSLVEVAVRQVAPLADDLGDELTPTGLSAWIEQLIAAFDRHAEVLRAARVLGGDEVARSLVEPLADWFSTRPGAISPSLSAELLLWHVERAAVRDDIVDHDELAAAVLRSVGVTDG